MNPVLNIQGYADIQGGITFTPSSHTQEVSNWIYNLQSNGLPLPSDTVLLALDNLILNLYSTGIRSKIRRLNLFCGGDWIGSFFPIIIDTGNIWDYNGIHGSTAPDLNNGPFQSSDWTLLNGFNASTNVNYYISGGNITGNTSTNTLKIIDTTVPANALGGYSTHMACYISADSASNVITINTDMGVGTGSENFNLQAAFSGNTSTVTRYNCYLQGTVPNQGDTAGGSLVSNFTTSRGFYVGTRQFISSGPPIQSSSVIFKNPLYYGAPSVRGYNPNNNSPSAVTLDSATISIFGRNNGTGAPGTVKSVSNVTNRSMYMYSLGTSLTNNDVRNYNNYINAFNIAIGRQIYTSY